MPKAAKKIDAPRRDIMQEVTDRILTELEKGAIPWVKPWSAQATSGMPHNYVTNRPYSGTNVILLWCAASAAGYATHQWLTFKQAQELGGTVRKGERGTMIIYLGVGKAKADETKGRDEDETYRFWKSFTVFNVAQCEGLPEKDLPIRAPRNTADRNAEIEDLLAAIGADVRHGHSQAAYIPSLDAITMPNFEDFASADNYYSTSFHEHIHWSGAKKRLDRGLKSRVTDIQSYALEELVAELGAAFCCADYGLDGDLRHAGYIASWIKELKADKTAFTRAASAANRAYKYLGECANAEADHAEAEGEGDEVLALAA